MNRRYPASFLALALLLGGCTKGSGITAANTTAVKAAAAIVGKGTATFKVVIPPAASLTNLKAKFISQNTKSITISVNGAAPPEEADVSNPATCTAGSNGTTCTLTVGAPAGVNTFLAQLWGTAGGTGNVLAQKSSSFTIVAEQDNPLAMTLAGVIGSVQIVPQTTNPAITGNSTSIPLNVTALDASGATIIGPYDQPIALTTTGTSLSLATTSLPDSSATASLGYDGSANSGTVCAGAPTETPAPQQACATITPSLKVTAISVSPSSALLTGGNVLQLSATVTRSDGSTETSVTWSSSNTDLATVNQSGVVSPGTVSGTATITASSNRDSSQSASASIAVTAYGPVQLTPASLTAFTQAGQTLSFTASQVGNSGTFTLGSTNCTSGSTTVATASPASGSGTFTVTAVAAGQCTLTVNGGGGGSASLSVGVTTTHPMLQ